MKTFARIVLLLSAILSQVAPALAEAETKTPAHQPSLADAPNIQVKLWGVTIANVRMQYQNITPQERAQRIAKQVSEIPVAAEYNIQIAPAREGHYAGAWVMVNDQRVFGLLQGDEPDNVTFDEHGALVKEQLELWLKRRAAQNNPELVALAVSYSLLATLIFAVAVYVVTRGRRRLLALLTRRSRAHQLNLAGIHFMPYVQMLMVGLVRLLMFSVIALFSYFWLTYVLYQFPYTLSAAQNLSNYIVGLLGSVGASILASVPDLLMVTIIFWLANVVNGIIKNIFQRIESGALHTEFFDPETAKATRRVFAVLVWILALVIAYPYIPGSDTEAFKGVSVFIGLIISLGSAGIVSQLLGGLIVVYSRAFQPGEYVKIDDYEGMVSVVGVLSTKIKTIRNEEVTIPNAVLLSATSTNYSRLTKDTGVFISTSVTIGYDTPWQQVHHLLLTAASRTEGLRKTPSPDVRQIALSDFYVEYRLIMFIDDPMQKVITLSAVHQQILNAFAEARVQIMSPHFEAQPEGNVLPGQWAPPGKTSS